MSREIKRIIKKRSQVEFYPPPPVFLPFTIPIALNAIISNDDDDDAINVRMSRIVLFLLASLDLLLGYCPVVVHLVFTGWLLFTSYWPIVIKINCIMLFSVIFFVFVQIQCIIWKCSIHLLVQLSSYSATESGLNSG